MRLVFLWGGAASGKLTVAREVSRLTGLPVFHNHLVVDALLPVFPFGDPAFVRLREDIWMSVFLEAAAASRSLIFTFAPEPTVSPDFAKRVKSAWTIVGGQLDFVRLTVPRDVQEERIASESRRAFRKLTSLELLRELRPQFEACEAAMPPPDLELDASRLLPAEAARSIVDALQLNAAG